MTTVSREVRINGSKEKVWAALADFSGIYVFNPSVNHSFSLNNQSQGLGAERQCNLTIAGSSIKERVIEWVDGEKMVIEIYDGTKAPPFKEAIATLKVRADGPNHTVVSGSLAYTLKYGLIGRMMDTMMIKPQFGKAWEGLFAGLKKHVETGTEIKGASGLDFDAVEIIPAVA